MKRITGWLACMAFTLACVISWTGTGCCAPAGDALKVLKKIPPWKVYLSTTGTVKPSIMMAAGESECLPIRFRAADSDSVRRIRFNANPFSGLNVEVFQVEWVPGRGTKEGGLPDPLVPLHRNDPIALSDGNSLLWLKVTAAPDIVPGRYSIVVKSARTDTNKVTTSLKIPVEVVNFVLPRQFPEIIQAGIIRPQGPDPESESIELLRFLAGYRFNSAAKILAPANPSEAESYYRIMQVAIDELGFDQVQLPAKSLLGRTASFSQKYGDSDKAYENYIGKQVKHLSNLDVVLNEPRWAGKFRYKLWDEPKAAWYPEVRRLYDMMHDRRPDLKLAVTMAPQENITDSIAAWIPHTDALKEQDAARVHSMGGSLCVYSNHWASIHRPAHSLRCVGWLLWKYKLDGYYYWGVNDWKADPWTTISSRAADNLKQGVLVYPDPAGTGRLLPSLRLEAFRDGIEDMLILQALEGKAEAADLLDNLRAVVENLKMNWKKAPPNLGTWRTEMLNHFR